VIANVAQPLREILLLTAVSTHMWSGTPSVYYAAIAPCYRVPHLTPGTTIISISVDPVCAVSQL